MEMFFVVWICGYQSFQGAACNSASGAYFQQINGQQVLDQATKRYIEPIPSDIKSTAIVSYALYTKRIHISLYRGLGLDIRVDKFNQNNSIVESTVNSISYNKSF